VLLKKGFKFRSETDTEVIPLFVQYFMAKGLTFIQAVKKTISQLRGYFAIVVLCSSSDTVIGARNGSPLVVGVNKDEYFISSDIPAFLEYTRDVIYLNDNEMVIVDNDLKFIDLNSNEVLRKEVVHIDWSLEHAEKGDYAHYMLKEIVEQAHTIRTAIEQPRDLIEAVTTMLKESQGVFFVGCGTSYHACVSASYEFAAIAKKHVNVILASEFSNYKDFLTKDTLMVALSQSGETIDLIEAVKTAQSKGVKVVAIVNVMGSSLARLADYTIMMNSGPEICVLSTKSYTSQLAILLLLAYSTAGRLEEGKRLIIAAAAQVKDLIATNLNHLRGLANRFKNEPDFFIIGRDLAYASALEAALKIKEVSYIHAEGFAGGELKHGTIALIDKNKPVIVLSTQKTRAHILANAAEIKARGGYIIGIDSCNNPIYDYFIHVPSMGNADPLVMIIPIQILAYYLALARKLDPDKPRNLAKSVTVK
jgi:glucosamine--fructose-6-phosphate aminotransferase (isomerizing)